MRQIKLGLKFEREIKVLLEICVYKVEKLIKNTFLKLEPVGSKAPTFSAESKSFTFVKYVNQSFGLLCQAQAFPVPLIRFVFFIKFNLC